MSRTSLNRYVNYLEMLRDLSRIVLSEKYITGEHMIVFLLTLVLLVMRIDMYCFLALVMVNYIS